MRERTAALLNSVLRWKCRGNAGARDHWLADLPHKPVDTYATAQTPPLAVLIVRTQRREPQEY